MIRLLVTLILFSSTAFAEGTFSDEETDTVDNLVRVELKKYFESHPHFVGPKGLLQLKNCDRVRVESVSPGLVPQEISESLEISFTVFLTAGRKSDSIEGTCKVKVVGREAPRTFKFDSAKFASEKLSPRDHCAETRKNSRLFSSVQSREILMGMPEVAVKASWGDWVSKTNAPDGSVILKYESREVKMRNGLVESWAQK